MLLILTGSSATASPECRVSNVIMDFIGLENSGLPPAGIIRMAQFRRYQTLSLLREVALLCPNAIALFICYGDFYLPPLSIIWFHGWLICYEVHVRQHG